MEERRGRETDLEIIDDVVVLLFRLGGFAEVLFFPKSIISVVRVVSAARSDGGNSFFPRNQTADRYTDALTPFPYDEEKQM